MQDSGSLTVAESYMAEVHMFAVQDLGIPPPPDAAEDDEGSIASDHMEDSNDDVMEYEEGFPAAQEPQSQVNRQNFAYERSPQDRSALMTPAMLIQASNVCGNQADFAASHFAALLHDTAALHSLISSEQPPDLQ